MRQIQTNKHSSGDHDFEHKMITHMELYNLANTLGMLAMVTVVAYHFVAVNAKHVSGQNGNTASS
ncbi:hypothetical protein WOLCODRAFT_158207 [Wolfiporia cocos MD-104 SS10]|uniref:Dolichyl-diphosphooligosaccharide--protein glycosyltransferase subunit 4 n=1 Tax=Wolfiporia cocos (strain MD-104) TaxID=742152 RepID=A0A2H3JFH0_WOLCO|nr:hypothetical protein WOLCODRAFT_158207 [Wolfiporia cocos MD-104 SS10]